MKRFHLLVAAAASAFATAMAPAAVQIVDSAGKLTGATGVIVKDKTYNVTFVDGTCASVYGSCVAGRFDFSNRDDADAAIFALGQQVLLDTTLGKFASDPALTFGCSIGFVCETFLVFSPASQTVNGMTNQNYNPLFDDRAGPTIVDLTADTSTNPARNYVRFSLVQTDVAGVPEPASWAMMIGGFGMVGAALRRRRRTSLRLA